jgi:hypothetical protein
LRKIHHKKKKEFEVKKKKFKKKKNGIQTNYWHVIKSSAFQNENYTYTPTWEPDISNIVIDKIVSYHIRM